ncbi:MAG: hypothetical protein IAE93_07520 [Ignavibacteria bacterium]|nr:hypothetical protein [Ignavibacteria bacterium]
MKYSKIKITAFLLFLFIVSGMVSCSKNTDDTADNEVKDADMVSISSDEVLETDEDLFSVDYKEFYDELAPHGEWVEVKGDEIGVDVKQGTSSGESKKSISFSDLFGIKAAYADNVNFGAFFVWKPAPNLAVGITAGEPPVYQPYTNGQWVHTNNGWYFRAASQHEEITHHYGRWVYTPAMGWLWVPGRVWAPAWVDWREEEEYIAWAPVPPSVYIVNNVIVAPPVYEERYVIVERRYFIEPEVYRYSYKVHKHKHKVKITEWRRMDGIMVVNNTVINRGPDVTIIQNVTGRSFEPVVINHVTGKNKIKYSDREYSVYSPEFRKVKKEVKVKGPVSKPKEFSDFRSASEKESGRNHKDNREMGNSKNETGTNESPGKDKKYIDDKNMKNGKNNESNNNKQRYNDDRRKNDNNGNKNKSEDRKKDSKQNDRVKEKKNDNDNSNRKEKGNEKRSGKEKGNKKFKNETNRNDIQKDGIEGEGERKHDRSGKNKHKR